MRPIYIYEVLSCSKQVQTSSVTMLFSLTMRRELTTEAIISPDIQSDCDYLVTVRVRPILSSAHCSFFSVGTSGVTLDPPFATCQIEE